MRTRFIALLAGAVVMALPAAAQADPSAGKIKHIVVIMQENRSFDSYFGTFPDASGIPPHVCVPDPLSDGCVTPYHSPADVNLGGPHYGFNASDSIDGGKMDGFISTVQRTRSWCNDGAGVCKPCVPPNYSNCIDAMGYHDSREIPNYWAYAKNFVLQDHMFESNASWSGPSHLELVSNWSAKCTTAAPLSCSTALESPGTTAGVYPWTDITWLLYRAGVSWGYYVNTGNSADCVNARAFAPTCAQPAQSAQAASIWNPLPLFATVKQDGQLNRIQDTSSFTSQASLGTLPAVSWLIPSAAVSEHPPSSIDAGQAYVTGLVNAVMQGPNWSSTAIFISWDDWGGFYDHIKPPVLDGLGYGIRVPGIVISPYAKTGLVDHQVLSHDAYNKFIEDVFLNGRRLNPATDGRPDSRPSVREASPILGSLTNDFDFTQAPRAPLLLPQAVGARPLQALLRSSADADFKPFSSLDARPAR